MPNPRTLLVVDGTVRMRQCALYRGRGHRCAVLERHHVCPESWFKHAGLPVQTPMVPLCPNCHASTHVGIDGLLAGRDVSGLPRRCVDLAEQGLAIAQQQGLKPAPTL